MAGAEVEEEEEWIMREYTGGCDRCAYHRDMWRRLRSMNLEQQKRCEVESANARSIHHQQGKQLALMKSRYIRLHTQHEELRRLRRDPFCRDAEIMRLRLELGESKAMTAAYNQTALSANNEARMYFGQLEDERTRCAALQQEIRGLRAELRLSEERVEVLQMVLPTTTMAPGEEGGGPNGEDARRTRLLEGASVGMCCDLVCRNRQLGWSHKVNMAAQEIAALKDQVQCLQEDVARARGESAHWRRRQYGLRHQPRGGDGEGGGASLSVGAEGGDPPPRLDHDDEDEEEGIGGGGSSSDDADDGDGGKGSAVGMMGDRHHRHRDGRRADNDDTNGRGGTQPSNGPPQERPRSRRRRREAGAIAAAAGANTNKLLVARLGREDELTLRLQSLFELVPGCDNDMDECAMYDEFLLDQEQHRRGEIMEMMYMACHGGEPMPDKDRRKLFKPGSPGEGAQQSLLAPPSALGGGSRVCRRSFSACLRAIGGVMVKRRSRNVWLNFRQTRQPIFKWCADARP